MAVNYESGVVTGTPVTEPREIQKLLGISTDDYENIMLADSINPYSRKKPTNSNVLNKLEDWQFKEVNWSYKIPDETQLSAVMAYINNGTLPVGKNWEQPSTARGSVDIGFGWYYVRPETWMRPYDFIGYAHFSPRALFGTLDVPSEVTQNTQSMYVQFNRGTFAFDDFGDFTTTGAQLGIIIAKKDSATAYIKSIPTEDSVADYPKISFTKSEMNQIFSGGYGEYRVYAVAVIGNVQNIDKSADYYVSNPSCRPLPQSYGVINYKYQGAESADIKFIIYDVVVDSRTVSFKLKAKNVGNAAEAAALANIKLKINARDNEGGQYNETSLRGLGLTGSSSIIPANGTIDINNEDYFDVSYSAYRTLNQGALPWYVNIMIYYPNSAGTDTFNASFEVEWNGE